MIHPQLMKHLGFDESDLQANRDGRLSEKQKTRLLRLDKRQKGCAVSGGILLFGVALAGAGVVVLFGPAIINEDRAAAIVVGAVFGCVWPLIWGGLGLLQLRRAFAKMEVQVKKAQGPLRIVTAIREEYNPSTKMHSEVSVCELRIGKRVFEVEPEIADLLTPGDVYAVYYADINIQDEEDPILSVEMLEKA